MANIPFVASMTCFTGAFENPNRQGLAEKMLFTANKGSIAGLSSASVGWKYNDFAVEWALMDYLWDDNFSFGLAVDFMKISYMASSLYYLDEGSINTPGWGWQGNSPLWSSMVNQYNLLGDPTLKLAKPAQKVNLILSTATPASGQRIQIEIDASAIMQDGNGEIEISNQDNVKYLQQNFSLTNGRQVIEFDTPQNRVGEQLKVKTFVSNNATDASGFANIAIERAVIKSVNIFPENTQITDSITFQITAGSYNPIDYMELRNFRNADGTGNHLLRVEMEKVNDSLFISADPLFWTLKEGLSYFEVYIRDVLNKESIYDLQKMNISDNRPDIEILASSLKYSGTEQLLLNFDVSNNSDVSLNNILINSFAGQDSLPFYSDSYSFDVREKKTISVPFTMDSLVESLHFTIQADPLNELAERSEINNSVLNKNVITDHILINNVIGTSINGINTNSITIFQDWQFHIEPNNIASTSVIAFSKQDIRQALLDNDQKDLNFIPFVNETDSAALKISSAVSFFATLSARVDSALSTASFFRYDNFLNLWVKIASEFTAGFVQANINQNGLYGIFTNNDANNPYVEITANGRSLVEGRSNLVSLNPSISILLQDENGIYYDSFSLSIDGNPLAQEDLVIPDSIINANSIAIVATPQLELGPHELQLSVSDVNNNLTEVFIAFNVSSDEGFKVYGNYPNPFEDRTIISFENLTQNELSEIKTRIYSVSGHLVRKKLLDSEEIYDDLLRINYHEFEWDGTDDNGNDVANGVYFLVIEARSVDSQNGKKSTFKRKLKIARLK